MTTTIATRAPAHIEVTATCPNCDQTAVLGLDLAAQLVMGDDGGELKLKSKSKGQSHICGQVALVDVAGVQAAAFDEDGTP